MLKVLTGSENIQISKQMQWQKTARAGKRKFIMLLLIYFEQVKASLLMFTGIGFHLC